GLAGVKRGGQLNAIHGEFLREREPFFDSTIRVLVADFTRGQFLECSGQHSNLHEFGFETLGSHDLLRCSGVYLPPESLTRRSVPIFPIRRSRRAHLKGLKSLLTKRFTLEDMYCMVCT